MIEIEVEREFSVPFGIASLETAAGRVICTSQFGQLAVLDPAEDEPYFFQVDVREPFKSVAISSRTGRIACVENTGLRVINPLDHSSEYWMGSYESCSFCHTSGILWTSTASDSELTRVEQRGSKGEVIDSVEVEKPYSAANLLYAHPVAGCVFYSSGAQDGQGIIWIAEANDGLETYDPIWGDELGFVFDLARNQLLAAEREGISVFMLEGLVEVETVAWPEEFHFAYLILLSERFALLQQYSDGRKYLFDLENKTIGDEIGISGDIYRGRFFGDSPYEFYSVERIYRDVGHQEGSKIRLWNWRDDLIRNS